VCRTAYTRAWLDFESYYSKDRATLQLQALVDQHTSTLTFTQLSQKAIDESAPVQDRLRYLHAIVYPPRWELRKDLADKYRSLGILVSASQIFQDLELWDDVVECYGAMGKKKEALAVVRERLAEGETPRMLCALGDLTEPPESLAHYEAAWALSKGRYARAKRSVGREEFGLASQAQQAEAKERGKGDDATNKPAAERTTDLGAAALLSASSKGHLEAAAAALALAVTVQPSATSDWFLLGTVRMRLERWQEALTAFSTVVAHDPDSVPAQATRSHAHTHA
jgi:tetratricopeptide (TPR) repeat protein